MLVSDYYLSLISEIAFNYDQLSILCTELDSAAQSWIYYVGQYHVQKCKKIKVGFVGFSVLHASVL